VSLAAATPSCCETDTSAPLRTRSRAPRSAVVRRRCSRTARVWPHSSA
jgi:hypothetical protein